MLQVPFFPTSSACAALHHVNSGMVTCTYMYNLRVPGHQRNVGFSENSNARNKKFNHQEQRIPPPSGTYRQNIELHSVEVPTKPPLPTRIRISCSCKVYTKRLYDHLRGQRGGHLCLTKCLPLFRPACLV